jgi:glycosyltransferase involved in cell wall biosynthesis
VQHVSDSEHRLLVVNNLPARYRVSSFDALLSAWRVISEGGEGHVVFQARRDPRRRQEWFFADESEIPFAHTYLSDNSVATKTLTFYRPAFGARLLRSMRPTHLFVAGWDSPAALACAAYARITKARLVLWVESNASTSRRQSRVASQFKRLSLESSSAVLVPSASSLSLVRSLTPKPLQVLVLPNPVTHSRIADAPTGQQKRLLFIGEMTSRKGFDTFMEACRAGAASGWTAIAWGDDREGLATQAPDNCQIRAPRPIEGIITEFRPDDVWVIPSRTDPAPLTYSEALALGLRVTVSDAIAYQTHAKKTPGAAVHRQGDAVSLLETAELLHRGQRPSAEVGLEVGNEHWATEVAHLIGAHASPEPVGRVR